MFHGQEHILTRYRIDAPRGPILHPFSDLDSSAAASHSQLSKTPSIELQKKLGFSILQK